MKDCRRYLGRTVVSGPVRQIGGCPLPRHRSSSGMAWWLEARSGSDMCSGRTPLSSSRHCPQTRQIPQSGSAHESGRGSTSPALRGPYVPPCTSASCTHSAMISTGVRHTALIALCRRGPGLVVGRAKSQTWCGKTPSSASGTACRPGRCTSSGSSLPRQPSNQHHDEGDQ
jgi:hypothetical protein